MNRTRQLNSAVITKGPVVYWMSRDQRIEDNWALLYAQELALQMQVPLHIVFVLQSNFLGATERQFSFMLQGLAEVARGAHQKNITFSLLHGEMVEELVKYVSMEKVGALVCDFSPLLIGRQWRERLSQEISIPLYEVDAHNVIPAWIVSQKQEFGAYTIRPKVHRLIREYLENFPEVTTHPYGASHSDTFDWQTELSGLHFTSNVPAVSWITPGEKSAQAALRLFLSERLETYDTDRNIPTLAGQSDLSPYLHFGQLSAQRVALEVERWSIENQKKDLEMLIHKDRNGSAVASSPSAFLEELVVRRELADNFCLYNHHYDLFSGFPAWAQQSLNEHRKDLREHTYSREELELGKTHDKAWNACQIEMVKRGKMHGYMRMYWAKKILEWTESPEQALEHAIYLNDTYELDGRDPNGYTGIAWSIGGVHDRPWFDRPIFGKIRYMAESGLRKKFDLDAYILSILSID